MSNPSNRSPGNQALRRGRASIPNHIYLVTTVAHERNRIFEDFDAACLASKTLTTPELWPDGKLLAWVLMPDHLHLLVELGDNEPLSRVIQRVKSVTASALHRHSGLPSSIWQRAYHERALRQSDDIRTAARYVIANPLRAGLVTAIGAYPFWGAIWMNPDNPDPL
jgi:REP element-mobilizing transposase RayT